ncbi:MAG: NAD+ synthase [Acidimicrobiales bacterium]
MTRMRVALAQVNPVVGDLDGNRDLVVAAIASADERGAALVAFPELVLTGYPPEDLLLKPRFVADNRQRLDEVAAATEGRGVVAVVGFVDGHVRSLFNAAAVCAGGRVVGTYHKRRLPNYAVFDEARYFLEGSEALSLFSVGGVKVGLSVCEDVWVFGGPVHELAEGGAELIVNVNASPYHAGKLLLREQTLADRAGEAHCPIVYVNQVGGQDELVFDGASMVVGADGSVLTRAGQFTDELLVVDVDVPSRDVPAGRGLPVVDVSAARAAGGPAVVPPAVPHLDRVAEVYEALVVGTRDYVRKNGFHDVVIGLSGGIDSSLVATIAADALGREHVHGVLMPSRYSSAGSITDAEALADNLGIEHRLIAIEPAQAAFLEMLAPSFSGLEPDLTEENLQSRIRGVLLMALSNKLGWLVLTTSNKSESAVGYSTLYGDSAGGFAVIKDVPKLLVYELCRLRNDRARTDLIPASVLEKPPSAELRPDQRDDQSLPPYEELDPIIEAYVEQDRTAAELVADGYDPEVVRRIVRLVDLAEYKRRQFPPGVRITTKAFGKDRRLPITNGYRG